jgi:hypothetical protein
VEGWEAKPGGTLFYIERDGDRWSLKQTINLNNILVKHSPLSVVCNGQWLVLSAIPKIRKDPAKILLFKRVEGEWELVPSPDCMLEFIFTSSFMNGEPSKRIAMSCDNQLYIGQASVSHIDENYKGKVFHFDLNTEPISLKETILPPPEQSVKYFGMSLNLMGDFMIIGAIGAYFSEEEIANYNNIIEEDYSVYADGRREPPRKDSMFAYKFNPEKNRWEYVTDFFEHLPHPPGGILRCPVQITSTKKGGDKYKYYPREYMTSPLATSPYVTPNRVFFNSKFAFYEFKTEDGSSWDFVKKITPHTFPIEHDKIKYTGNYTSPFDIGEKYSTYFNGNTGHFEVYLTEEFENWKPLWKVAFDTEHYPQKATNSHRQICVHKFCIVDDSILAYLLIRTDNPRTQEIFSTGRVVIYDIDDIDGPKETFRLETLGRGIFVEK